MSKQAKTMLIIACIFATISAVLLYFDAYMSISTYVLLFGSKAEDLGDALGKVFGTVILYAMTIILGIGVVASSAVVLPFDIRLLKLQGKKWYSIVLLVFAIVAIVSAVVFVAMLPVVGQIQDAARSASSSSDISSSEALLLL